MKAVLYDGPRSYAVTDIPTPEAGPGEVRIRVEQVGVCGTDLHIHNGDFNAVFPLIPGHELVGVVDALGDGRRAVRGGRAGIGEPQRLLRQAATTACPGRLILCADAKGLGSNYPGFFAEYVTVPAKLVFSVQGSPLDTAVFTEPAACAMHGLETLDLRPGSSALVFGAGPTGLLLAQLIASGGASSVTVAAPTQFKLDRASALGASQTVLIDAGRRGGKPARRFATPPGATGTTSSSRRRARPGSATSACP